MRAEGKGKANINSNFEARWVTRLVRVPTGRKLREISPLAPRFVHLARPRVIREHLFLGDRESQRSLLSRLLYLPSRRLLRDAFLFSLDSTRFDSWCRRVNGQVSHARIFHFARTWRNNPTEFRRGQGEICAGIAWCAFSRKCSSFTR